MKRRIVLFYIVALVSCVKDKPQQESILPTNVQQGILMLNEGALGNNNADLSYLDPSLSNINNFLFYKANQKPIGDVAQDVQLINQELWVSVNNSNKIEVLDAANFKSIAQINGLTLPRYIMQVQNNKVYVSSWNTKNVYVVDINSRQVTKKIQLDYRSSEQMLLLGKYAYVTQWDTACAFIYKINVETDAIESRIAIGGKAAHSLQVDKNNCLWVLAGNQYFGVNSTLTCIDLKQESIINTYLFDAEQEPLKLCMNQAGEFLYYIMVNYTGAQSNNGIYRMHIQDTHLPKQAMLSSSSSSYYWGLGIQPLSNYIFVADPKGFSQQSDIWVFDQNFTLLKSFKGGIACNKFSFLK